MKLNAIYVLTTLVINSLVFAAANAEQLYVSDKLVVGVFPEAGQESGKLTNIESGDMVEALEEQDKYTRVRLANGTEGWVRTNYLTTQMPAVVRLKALQAERGPAERGPAEPAQLQANQTRLTQEIVQLKAQNLSLQKERDALKQVRETDQTNANVAPSTLTTENFTTNASAPASPPITAGKHSFKHSLGYGLAFIASGVIIGFVLGYQALARRIRRKYGSVKIY